jgi:hypothetical protein
MGIGSKSIDINGNPNAGKRVPDKKPQIFDFSNIRLVIKTSSELSSTKIIFLLSNVSPL